MIIRNAVIEDAHFIGELSTQLGYPTSTTQSAARLREILGSNEHLLLVASLDTGSVVGWVHVFFALRVESDPFAELGGFVVGDRFRGQGIGTRLLETAEQRIIQRGLQKLRVRSRSTRTNAHTFYQRLGFSKTKEQYVYDKQLNTGA